MSPASRPPLRNPALASQRLVEVKEEAHGLAASTGTDILQATLFGAPALQPSKAEPSPKGLSLGGAVILVLVLGPLLVGVITVLRSL